VFFFLRGSLNDNVVEDWLNGELVHLEDRVKYIFVFLCLFLPLWVRVLLTSDGSKELTISLLAIFDLLFEFTFLCVINVFINDCSYLACTQVRRARRVYGQGIPVRVNFVPLEYCSARSELSLIVSFP
jgi:hypothetical protein